MKTALAIMTYRRFSALRTCLESLRLHLPVPPLPLAVFEDCGQTDGTEAYLVSGCRFVRRDCGYEADAYCSEDASMSVFLGLRNLGVTGNTNRALRWFLEETDADHLCLLNDDVEILGPFWSDYAAAHVHHGVGLFCFCDFTSDKYLATLVQHKGRPVKLLTRMTGIMLSLTRELVETVGYFDDDFATFGEEHSDYTNRARFAGFIRLNGNDQHCLDIPTSLLRHQEVPSCIRDNERARLDTEASEAMSRAAAGYRWRDIYRPYSTATRTPKFIGGQSGFGIPRHKQRLLSVVLDRGPDGHEGELLPVTAGS